MGKPTAKQIAAAKQASILAQGTLKFGDRIGRTRCGGSKSTFVFTHWEGVWICGKSVHDCHASHIYSVNGKPLSFYGLALYASP